MSDYKRELLTGLSYNLGPAVMRAIEDPDVVEIMANPDGKLWIEKLGRPMELFGELSPEQTKSVILLMASSLNYQATVESPIVEGELPIDGSRFEGVIPPIVSQASFTIRKKASQVFSLEDYVASRTMPGFLAGKIKDSIIKRDNIVVVGGTGSGKTTLVNGIILAISELCPEQRLIIMEDTLELQSRSENTVFFRTSDRINMARLLKMTMRYRPDRIIIGEVRDKAALDLLKAWNTGHPGGIATIHANSAIEGLARMEELTEEAGLGSKNNLIARAVDLVIFIRRSPGGRKVSQAITVLGYNHKNHNYRTEVIYHETIEPEA
ncbi:MAG: P-type conjugative transfer ATPase TrbB [Deltaproteobacteria bacterium]|jgi:type IV secretion system protein VirB11|nr:P-type conjugative transfer ATPase TrbB [Deltaproteobacteria bacterium]